MLLESVVEEALTEFISAGHVEISRLTLGVGRGKLARRSRSCTEMCADRVFR